MPEQFKILLAGYYAGTLTAEEKRELIRLLHSAEEGQDLQGFFPERLGDPELENLAVPETLGLIYEQVLSENAIERGEDIQHGERRRFVGDVEKGEDIQHDERRRFVGDVERGEAVHHRIGNWNWRSLAVAASILIAIVGTGAYFIFRPESKPPVATLSRDIKAPVSSRATITLGNGQQVYLDSVANGQLAIQGNARLVKLTNGQVAYRAGGPGKGQILFNTLVNPRGSRVVTVTLSDGTKVWLNAESSLKYPAVFAGTDRTVEMTGEAYFEVARNASDPFIVHTAQQSIRVLGTGFNVHAYADEPNTVTTLVEGKVEVNASGKTLVLEPGEKAQLSKSGALSLEPDPNVEEATAWKNGYFRFNKADIHTIMLQLSRWYDAEVSYEEGTAPHYFGAIISRDNNISQILQMLEATGEVHFKVKGKEIIVMP
jgi:ferric-dicitrate binding protein FerR (iron transport regulator)